MSLKLSDVDLTVKLMDEHYDANFGSWIRNERNAAVVGFHLHKYIEDYNICDFIVVVKWIVRSWTLRSIIILSKAMVIEDIKSMSNRKKGESYKSFRIRMVALSGLIYTWNNLFIIEFMNSLSKDMDNKEQTKFIANLLIYFDKEKMVEIMCLVGNKFGKDIEELLSRMLKKRSKKITNPIKRISKDVKESFCIS